MARLTYNLNEIEEFPTFSEGMFRIRVKKVVKGKSKAGGAMLIWDWKIMSGPSKGNTAKSWTLISGDNLGQLKQHMVALGYAGKIDLDTDKLIGKECRGVFKERTYTDKEGVEKTTVGLNSFMPLKKVSADEDEDVEENDDSDDAPRRKASKARPSKNRDEDEDEPEEDDEDEKPRKAKKRPVVDDDEDEAPRKSKKRTPLASFDPDEDEDDRPAKKRKKASRDDEDDDDGDLPF